MAVLDSLPNIKVSVMSGEEELKEYAYNAADNYPPEGNTVAVFIECGDGTPFSFRVEKDS